VKPSAKDDTAELLSIDDHTVRITHPEKLYFSREVQLSKLDLVRYALAIAPGALQGIRDRPIVLKRFVNGACLESGQPEPFYQKRAPTDLPEFLRTVTLSFPSGRTAEEVVVDNPAGLAFIVNLGCIELHPHPVRSTDLDHPDELRIDLDPGPGVDWPDVRAVALEVKAILEENGLIGWPKTSGSRGMHVNVRIHPRWTFTEVRRAALALARAVERRVPTLASSKWWKEERHGVFLDYNQNAKDRTTASAFSVRPLPDARVSAPLNWHEVPDANPADFTVLTMPRRFTDIGNPHEAMDASPGSLDPLLALAARDEAEGLGDAPWPPHFVKQEGEAKRVQPSKAKSSASKEKAFDQQMREGFGAHRFKKRSKATTTPSSSTEDQAPAATITSSSSTEDQASAASSSSTEDQAPTARSIPAWGEAPGPNEKNNHRAESPAYSTSAQPEATRKTHKTPTKRIPKHPLIIVAQSTDKSAAEAGLDRWKAAHPEAAQHLAVDDILIDRMRGSSSIWYRIRVNLRHVPEEIRPTQQTPDPDDDPTRAWREASA
jgi:bifunctional non-homologous end joining protein LigD